MPGGGALWASRSRRTARPGRQRGVGWPRQAIIQAISKSGGTSRSGCCYASRTSEASSPSVGGSNHPGGRAGGRSLPHPVRRRPGVAGGSRGSAPAARHARSVPVVRRDLAAGEPAPVRHRRRQQRPPLRQAEPGPAGSGRGEGAHACPPSLPAGRRVTGAQPPRLVFLTVGPQPLRCDTGRRCPGRCTRGIRSGCHASW